MARALLLLLGLGLAAAIPAAAAGRSPVHHVVEIEGMHFVPARLVVHAGDTVTWVNRDLVPHTVTAGGGGPDSPQVAAGASWSWVAAGRGPLAYRCLYHPMMAGRLELRP